MRRITTTTKPLVARLLTSATIVAALSTIPLSVAHERGAADHPLVLAGDWAVWAVFFAEFTVLFFLTSERRSYARRSWFNLIIIVLTFPLLIPALEILRLARLARLARVVLVAWWGFRELDSVLGRRGLLHVVTITGVLIVAGGGLMSIIEPQTFHGDFWSGVWWALVTVTTVGYGDFSPVSPAGRIVAGALMLSGIGLVSTLAASISAYFVSKDQEDAAAMAARLVRMERMLERLTANSNAEPERDEAVALVAPHRPQRARVAANHR